MDCVAKRPLGRFVQADFDYVEGVAEAGGVPVVLPPVAGDRAAEDLLDGLDGLLLSGGSDLDPGYYGTEPVPELGVTMPERDAFEIALLEHALRRKIPILGICRGDADPQRGSRRDALSGSSLADGSHGPARASPGDA